MAHFVLQQIGGLIAGDPEAERELEESMEALALDLVEQAGGDRGYD